MIMKFLLFSLFFLTSYISNSITVDFNLSDYSPDNDAIILGDSNKDPKMTQVFTEKVSNYISKTSCLNVVVEINSDQQDILNSYLKGNSNIYDLKFNERLNRNDYKIMLEKFRQLVSVGNCIEFIAIDPPPTVPFNRDARMEKKLTDSIGIIPTLILSDQERAIKYDSWDSKGKYKSYLAKRIQNKGASTVSLLDY